MVNWTAEMDATIARMVSEDSTTLEIAAVLGVTRVQVSSRMGHLGIRLTQKAFLRSRSVNMRKVKATRKKAGTEAHRWDVPPVPEDKASQAAQFLRRHYRSVWNLGRENKKLKGYWYIEGMHVPEKKMIQMARERNWAG